MCDRHFKDESLVFSMSYVQLLIIKDDCVYLVSVPYRSAMKVLENGIEKLTPMLKSRFLDAGYVVVDCNKKVIINGQFAFPIGKTLKGFDVFEV